MDSPTLAVREQFATALQQRRSDLLGMWLMLSSEVMMFGGLFMAIIVYRYGKHEVLSVASGHLDMMLAGVNTAILLTSSLFMALAVIAARQGAVIPTLRWLGVCAALGIAFLAVKAHEYQVEYDEGLMPSIGPAFPIDLPGAELFFNLYYVATGLHALHLAIGIGLVLVLIGRLALRLLDLPERRIDIEVVGLYWHFVDIVWVFLYPVLYLVGR